MCDLDFAAAIFCPSGQGHPLGKTTQRPPPRSLLSEQNLSTILGHSGDAASLLVGGAMATWGAMNATSVLGMVALATGGSVAANGITSLFTELNQ
jgi:hypothetical protein